MAFGQDFLRTFFGNDYLKDYTHASKTFRTNGYENAPRLKFLFHVYFTINDQIPALQDLYNKDDWRIGLLVKSIDLPRYQLDVETLNQYNRKRLIQKKIEYQPVRAVFHDDGGDLIRSMWYNYYAYYYKDPSQRYKQPTASNGTAGPDANRTTGFDYNNRDIYANDRFVNDWGYIGEAYSDGAASAGSGGKLPFFRDITIYGFNQHKYVAYTLINPLITNWDHDTYAYEDDAGIMQNTMTIRYETVKYYTGAIGGVRPSAAVPGFASPEYYDQVQSPLSKPGGTRSILGQGGLLDTGVGIVEDLQAGSVAGLIGAVQKAGTAYGTFKGADLRAIVNEEARGAARDVLRNTIPAQVREQPNGNPGALQGTQEAIRQRGTIFPTPPRGSAS
jgi:hypothetical protein